MPRFLMLKKETLAGLYSFGWNLSTLIGTEEDDKFCIIKSRITILKPLLQRCDAQELNPWNPWLWLEPDYKC